MTDSFGLNKREHIAALAMQSLQNVLIPNSGQSLVNKLAEHHKSDCLHEIIAKEAVLQANALIKELNKVPQ